MVKAKKILAGLCMASLASTALADDWNFGIGTGISALDVSGDGGFHTNFAGGTPIDFDASLSPDDVNEFLESAYGLGGFASNGDLTISFSVGQLELEESVTIQGTTNTGVIDLNFKTIGAEILGDYTFSRQGKNSWGAIAGIRYTDQEYKGTLTVNSGTPFSRSVDESWVDLVIGASHSYAISQTLIWSSQVDYGFIGSEGTMHINTGVSKIINPKWLVRGSIDYKDIEFEQGNRGDTDWFYYEAKETIVAVSLLYLF